MIINFDGQQENNIIGNITGEIVGEFGGARISDEDKQKLEINILLNMKCKRLVDFEV